MEFAARRARERFPKLKVQSETPTGRGVTTLLLSHVLTELSSQQIDELIALAMSATTVMWIEPGTPVASHRLIATRERMRGNFRVVAPCTHQTACGMLAPENSRHWCHHFAPSPPQVFTDGNWVRFAKIAGVDLRSLPLSFLVLDKSPQSALPQGATRIIGEPRVYKAHALILGCDESGVRERRLMKRNDSEEFRRLKKGDVDPLQLWKCEGDEIVEVRPLL
jgi:ribosomal protein RSM22 (predicted rRNA methylase)